MKAKLSVTLDESIVGFLDSEPGANRSEKIEGIVKQYRRVKEEFMLREQLAKSEPLDDAEGDAWRSVMEESQWKKSDAATSGQSRSRRSRSRARR